AKGTSYTPPSPGRGRKPRAQRHDASSASAHRFSLAADHRARLALELVRESAQRSCRAGELLQRIAQILLRRCIGAKQRCVGAVHRPLYRAERTMQIVERGLELRYQLRVGVAHELRRGGERLVQALEVFLDAVADRVERHLVDLVENAAELGLELDQGAGNDGKLRRCLGKVDLDLRCFREVVEGYIELAGEQAAASQLDAKTAFLDEPLQECIALALVQQAGRSAAILPRQVQL